LPRPGSDEDLLYWEREHVRKSKGERKRGVVLPTFQISDRLRVHADEFGQLETAQLRALTQFGDSVGKRRL
jgi:hypothetical protein